MNFQLTSGERVLWQGAPGQGIRFQAQDWFAIPFAAVWLAVIFTAVSATPASARDPGFYLIPPLFLLIGLYMLVGRFILDMLSRAKTEYALTNRRAIIETGLFRRSTRSINLAAAPEIRLSEGRSGRGTIEFGSGSPFGFMPRGWPGMSRHLSPAFENIENASSIYSTVLDAQRDAQSAR
jgi:hypothetical protein